MVPRCQLPPPSPSATVNTPPVCFRVLGDCRDLTMEISQGLGGMTLDTGML